MNAMTVITLVWKNRDKALVGVVVSLLFVVYLLNGLVQSLEVALAAKPRIETRIETRVETKIETRIVQGPERIVEKIIIKPGGERIVERIIYRDRIVTVTGTETVKEVEEETEQDPVVARSCMASNGSRIIVGASLSPFEIDGIRTLRMARVGYSFQNRIDLTYGYDLWAPRHLAEISFRF